MHQILRLDCSVARACSACATPIALDRAHGISQRRSGAWTLAATSGRPGRVRRYLTGKLSFQVPSPSCVGPHGSSGYGTGAPVALRVGMMAFASRRKLPSEADNSATSPGWSEARFRVSSRSARRGCAGTPAPTRTCGRSRFPLSGGRSRARPERGSGEPQRGGVVVGLGR